MEGRGRKGDGEGKSNDLLTYSCRCGDAGLTSWKYSQLHFYILGAALQISIFLKSQLGNICAKFTGNCG